MRRRSRRGLAFVSRVATAVLCLAFSAHLPLLSLCAGGFKYLEFALEVPASLAGRRIRPVFKSGGRLFNSRLGVSLRLRCFLLLVQTGTVSTEFTEFRCISRGGASAPRRDAAAVGRGGAASARRRRDADAATAMATRRRQRQLAFLLLSSPLPLLPSFPSLCARARERRWRYVARAAAVGRPRRRQRQPASQTTGSSSSSSSRSRCRCSSSIIAPVPPGLSIFEYTTAPFLPRSEKSLVAPILPAGSKYRIIAPFPPGSEYL